MPGTIFRETIIWMGHFPENIEEKVILSAIKKLYSIASYADSEIVGFLVQFYPPPTKIMFGKYEYVYLSLNPVHDHIPCRILYNFEDIRYFTFRNTKELDNHSQLRITQIPALVNI